MGEVFVWAQRHTTHGFPKRKLGKPQRVKDWPTLDSTPIYVHAGLFFFLLFLHRILMCSPGWSGACGSRLPQNVETSSLLHPTLGYVGVCVLCLSLMSEHGALCFRKCPSQKGVKGTASGLRGLQKRHSQGAQRDPGRTAGLHFSIAKLNRSEHEQ